MLSQDAISQIFSLLPRSRVELASRYITNYHVTNRIRVEYTGYMGSTDVVIYVDGADHCIDADDRKAFLKYLKEVNQSNRNISVNDAESTMDDLYRQVSRRRGGKELLRIEDHL